MMAPDRMVPFRWPAAWQDVALLKLLEGTPLNCLLFPADAATHPVAEAARRAGLMVMPVESVPVAPLSEIKWDSVSPQVAITDLVWPRMKMSPKGKPDDIAVAPTGAPWIDSNSWVARLVAVRAPTKPVWLSFEPSPKEAAPDDAAYTIAIADSAATGARWIVTLDDRLVKSLPAGNADALKRWKTIASSLAFFEEHRNWTSFEPQGPLGVISSFAGKDEYLGQEMLNLAARRNLLYRVIDRMLPATHKLDGLRGVLYVDSDSPIPELKGRLTAFARNGGLLIVPQTLASLFPPERPLQCPVAGYNLSTFGKGSVAIGTREWDDPYFLAADVHSLVSRRNDPVRLFNGQSLWAHYSVAAKGDAALLQLVSFTSRPNLSVTVAATKAWRSATLHVIGADKPIRLDALKVERLTEFNLPSFSYFAALEFQA